MVSTISDYMYTLVCCGRDVDIYAGRESECRTCRTVFVPSAVDTELCRSKRVADSRPDNLFDGLTMDEALALRKAFHAARENLRIAKMGSAELVIELGYGPVRDIIKANHYGYCEILSEIGDLSRELFMANLA